MQYKTICLQMIQGRPKLYDRLLKSRTLLSTLEHTASELKEFHELWKNRLIEAKPASSPSQIASEALELALQDMEEVLPSESPQDETETLSLEAAMACIIPMPSA